MATSFTALECGVGAGRVFLRGEDRGWGAYSRRPSDHMLPVHRKPTRSAGVHTHQRQVARDALTAADPSRQRRLEIAARTTQYIVDPSSLGKEATLVSSGTRADGGKEEEEEEEEERRNQREPVSPEKLDEWMRESVVEIVRNIGEAPFLVHVFFDKEAADPASTWSSSSSTSSPGVRLEREIADAESWPHIRRRWDQGSCPPPDGVILVEELRGGSEQEEDEDEDEREASSGCSSSASASSGESNNNKKWGLVVQGRGVNCAACYILDTCRVQSPFGFCTHFCLARANCFGETAEMQFKRAWLVGRH